ncbi:hypothetical protein N0V83_003040 [Neocucurbitaria cava]|uniref:4-nitrophenylphosphatase n=1 Tax=Neocucurbitaria cava TaxID=798079 RepID=A0A9W9CQ76_9PLEO|nr:hypothetical protein N0V83_003040 [Neocucurbitaria cava]
MAPKPSLKAAEDFLSFVNASPTPFHAVKSAKERLEKVGFKQIKERDSWASTIQAGGKYYLTRNGSSIVAFAVGKKWKAGNPISMIGAHTDSPCLRIKPVSKRQSDGFLQVACETYGGGLWHTWFDRDLSVAGRAMVRTKEGNIEQRLVKVERPILRVPTLAIHLDRQENFQFNKETQLFPIAGLAAAELNRQGKTEESKDEATPTKDDSQIEPLAAPTSRHHSYLVEIIAEEAGADANDVLDFEMVLYDTQKSAIGGLNNELIFSPRLDNLMMTFCSVEGLIKSVSSSTALDNASTIRLIACFDHEEIGSQTAQGADSNLLPAVIRRLSVLPASESESDKSYDKVEADTATAYEQTLSTSFLISADMAHSVHPNYPAKYESQHRPEMNKGTVIKINANARYATNTPGIVLLQEAARRAKPASSSPSSIKAGVPLQLFVVRNDSSCGSTIGPMLSAAMGARTLDLGNPQLSMHSIRETGGAHDVEHAVNLFDSFFENFEELEKKITMSKPLFLSGDKAAIEEFISRFDVFLFDCDGVLWSGDHLYEKVPETIEMLRSRGKQLVFVTNNSTKSRADYKKKFDKLGIPAEVNEVFGSSYSAAVYIARILKLPAPKNKVFVLGESGVEQELESEGVPFIGGTDPAFRRDIRPEDFENISNGSLLDPDVGVVLSGLDFHSNYLKTAIAFQYLQRGAKYLATNTDSTLPMAHTFFPGAGSSGAGLAKAIGREPLSLGKPSQAMMDAVEGKFQFDRSRTCMVGDRLNTDIQFGIDGKLGGTLAVLTGVSKKEEFLAEGAPTVPMAYVNALGDLLG